MYCKGLFKCYSNIYLNSLLDLQSMLEVALSKVAFRYTVYFKISNSKLEKALAFKIVN